MSGQTFTSTGGPSDLLIAQSRAIPLTRGVDEPTCHTRPGNIGIPPYARQQVFNELLRWGLLVRLEDGTYQRRDYVAPHEEPPVVRDDNPEYAGFRAGVRKIVDERLRELGLIA